MTGFVCREHPTEVVSWRGTGCAQCARPRTAKPGDPVLTAEWKAWRAAHTYEPTTEGVTR